ncbi:MAG: hypothetical protein AB1409_13040, partial [Pseudomonadota bacterium]
MQSQHGPEGFLRGRVVFVHHGASPAATASGRQAAWLKENLLPFRFFGRRLPHAQQSCCKKVAKPAGRCYKHQQQSVHCFFLEEEYYMNKILAAAIAAAIIAPASAMA